MALGVGYAGWSYYWRVTFYDPRGLQMFVLLGFLFAVCGRSMSLDGLKYK
jgi:hypothetical protein